MEKKFTILLTSDETTNKKFVDIFNKFVLVTENQFDDNKIFNETTILERFNFIKWIQSISSASLIITPECGCTHIASVCKIPSKIIYDPENMPEAINLEYAPLYEKYEKFKFDQKNLNYELTKNL